MYTTKYRPNKLEDFVGNKNVIPVRPVRKNNLYDDVVFSKPNKHKCQPPAAR